MPRDPTPMVPIHDASFSFLADLNRTVNAALKLSFSPSFVPFGWLSVETVNVAIRFPNSTSADRAVFETHSLPVPRWLGPANDTPRPFSQMVSRPRRKSRLALEDGAKRRRDRSLHLLGVAM